jgi:hypothetical protein
MPVSLWLGLEDCLDAVTSSQPGSVLDAGIGFGLWGHLLRQYLDVWEGRITRDQWRVRIDGIEIDERRIQVHSRYLYDEVFVGDIRERVPDLGRQRGYDVILFGDVLEHLPKADAVRVLREAVVLANKRVIVRVPLGDGWRREGRTPPDHHRSRWAVGDFAEMLAIVRRYDYVGNPYALVVVDAPATRRAMLVRAERRLVRVEERLRRLIRRAADGG